LRLTSPALPTKPKGGQRPAHLRKAGGPARPRPTTADRPAPVRAQICPYGAEFRLTARTFRTAPIGGYRGANHYRAVTVSNKARRQSGKSSGDGSIQATCALPSQSPAAATTTSSSNFPSDQRDQEACLGLVTRCISAPSPPTLMQNSYELRHSPVKKGPENTSYLVSAVHGGSRGYRLCHVHPHALHQVSTVTGVL
jgi:hypothetical protein